MSDDSKAHLQLGSIAEKLKAGEEVPAITTREFLSWIGASRRGWRRLMHLDALLEEYQLYTRPDLQDTWIDGELQFVLSRAFLETLPPSDPRYMAPHSFDDNEEEERIEDTLGGYAVRRLSSANVRLISVKPDATVEQVITKMMAHGVSQIPVMQNDRDLKGVVTWKSLGTRLALQRSAVTARDCMEPAAEITASDDVFSVVSRIREKEYALVQADDRTYSGIVTTSDLSEILHVWAEPFLIIGEIEKRVRHLVRPHFGSADLKTLFDHADCPPDPTVDGLTIGQYIRLLQKPEHWLRLNIRLDRSEFLELLEQVREIRNDVMHFDPDPLESGELATLRNFLRLLEQVQA